MDGSRLSGGARSRGLCSVGGWFRSGGFPSRRAWVLCCARCASLRSRLVFRPCSRFALLGGVLVWVERLNANTSDFWLVLRGVSLSHVLPIGAARLARCSDGQTLGAVSVGLVFALVFSPRLGSFVKARREEMKKW